MWIKSCEFANLSYPFELISVAKDFDLSFLYYPEGSELLLSNSELSLISFTDTLSLLCLLLEVGGDAVINVVGWDGSSLQVALKR